MTLPINIGNYNFSSYYPLLLFGIWRAANPNDDYSGIAVLKKIDGNAIIARKTGFANLSAISLSNNTLVITCGLYMSIALIGALK